MKTLTVTKAREKLGHWVKRAAAGEEIGIVIGARLVALRPVPIEAGDYAEREYALTSTEVDRAAEKIRTESQRIIAAGDFVTAEEFSHALTGLGRKVASKSRRKSSRK